MDIKFGTSGWREVFGEGFTFGNVRRLTQAIAEHLHDRDRADDGVIVASDYRFLAERLVNEACAVLSGNGIRALRAGFAPTPAVSWAILDRRAAGAINFTASHNPPEYNGLKFNPAWGGPALPEDTNDIAARANAEGAEERVRRISASEAREAGLIEDIDPRTSYLSQLERLVDFDAVRSLSIAVDPMFGAGRGFLDEILRKNEVEVDVLHDHRDVLFGGSSPDPVADHLVELSAAVQRDKRNIGIATDGDADRFGIVDEDGEFVIPNYVIALLFDYLVGERHIEGGAARSVSTTHLVDLVGAHHDRPVEEVPVGFKYIGKAIAEDRIAIGGEESGGLSIRGHVPEKDGVLACLLACELRARRGKSFRQMLEELWSRVGTLRSARVNESFDAEQRDQIVERIAHAPKEFAGRRVERVSESDGLKLYLEGGAWFLVRLSGTEPVVRLYAESETQADLERLLDAGRAFLLG